MRLGGAVVAVRRQAVDGVLPPPPRLFSGGAKAPLAPAGCDSHGAIETVETSRLRRLITVRLSDLRILPRSFLDGDGHD